MLAPSSLPASLSRSSNLPLLLALLFAFSAIELGLSSHLFHQGKFNGFSSIEQKRSLVYALVCSSWGVLVSTRMWVGVRCASREKSRLQWLQRPVLFANTVVWTSNLVVLRTVDVAEVWIKIQMAQVLVAAVLVVLSATALLAPVSVAQQHRIALEVDGERAEKPVSV